MRSLLLAALLMIPATAQDEKAEKAPDASAAPAEASAAEADSFQAQGNRCFEMRTYHTHPGKLPELHRRFKNHTNAIFVKHGMALVGYWTPEDQPDTLVYILAYPDRAARDAAWKAFGSDPDWKAAFKASRADGPLVKKVDSVFLSATNYSPVQ